MANKSKRKPAEIVQCPHCDHKGSIRGLFTHTRLAHPQHEYIKPIKKTVNYYVVPENDLSNSLEEYKKFTKTRVSLMDGIKKEFPNIGKDLENLMMMSEIIAKRVHAQLKNSENYLEIQNRKTK
jgi:hypothetical protein